MSNPSKEELDKVRSYAQAFIDHGCGLSSLAYKLEMSPQTLRKFLLGEGVSLKINYKMSEWYKRRPV